MLWKDVPLRTRRVLSFYKVCGDSALLVFNRTLLNSINDVLALSWQYTWFFPQKRNSRLSVPCEICHIFVPSLDKAFSAEENDTNFESMPTSWNTVIFKLCLIFATDERRIVLGKAFHEVFSGSPLIRGNKRNTDQWASTKHYMEGFSRHNSSLIGRKNQVKFENYCISRNGHRIKITQPSIMILVSFSSVGRCFI